jgi:hypothetical protein
VRVLLRQLAELRGAPVLAGKEIVKLNFGQRDTPLLKMMRTECAMPGRSRNAFERRRTNEAA